MKLSAAVSLALATFAMARNCTPGLNYCGSTLLAIGKSNWIELGFVFDSHITIGDYQAQIDQSLADAGQGNANNGRDDLFQCIGGDNGVIKFLQYCGNGCKDEGSGVSDRCL